MMKITQHHHSSKINCCRVKSKAPSVSSTTASPRPSRNTSFQLQQALCSVANKQYVLRWMLLSQPDLSFFYNLTDLGSFEELMQAIVSQWKPWEENLCPLNISQVLFAWNNHVWSRKTKCSGRDLIYSLLLMLKSLSFKKMINKLSFIWNMSEWKAHLQQQSWEKLKF